MLIEILKTDITKESTDAIVNAANEGLYKGGGVCKAIHDAAGFGVTKECLKLKGVMVDSNSEIIDNPQDYPNPDKIKIEFRKRTHYIQRCKTGEVKTTKAGKLNNKYILHAVGPVYIDGNNQENELLYKTYISILEEANKLNLKSISIPAISTGIFDYPLDEASYVSLKAVKEFIDNNKISLELIRFCIFDNETLKAFQDSYNKVFNN